LVIGALSLLTARAILAAGGGFETLMIVLAIVAVLVFLSALLLPAEDNAITEAAPSPAE
jgi:hypothetical protein